MRRLRLLLDANVLVDAQVRDLFFRLAEEELIEVRWSSMIVVETRRALVNRLGVSVSRVELLLDAMAMAFPEAAVDEFDRLHPVAGLPDPGDEHVLAAAVAGECDILVTDNVRDFPQHITRPFGIEVLNADETIVLLATDFAEFVGPVVEKQIAALKRPTMTALEFLDRLASRAPQGAGAIGAAMGVEPYARIFADSVAASSSEGPQELVRRLLASIEEDDLRVIETLVDRDLAARLTGSDLPTAREVKDAIAAAVADVFVSDGWGFVTAPRLLSPDVELVKLLRVGNEPILVRTPRVAVGHLFVVRRVGDRWMLIDLDGEDPALSDSATKPR